MVGAPQDPGTSGPSASSGASPTSKTWERELLRAPEPSKPSEAEAKAAENRTKGLVKVSMNFSPQTVEALRELSRKSGTTMTEVVRRSIGLQKFITDEIEAGAKVLVEDAKGQMKQVLLH